MVESGVIELFSKLIMQKISEKLRSRVFICHPLLFSNLPTNDEVKVMTDARKRHIKERIVGINLLEMDIIAAPCHALDDMGRGHWFVTAVFIDNNGNDGTKSQICIIDSIKNDERSRIAIE